MKRSAMSNRHRFPSGQIVALVTVLIVLVAMAENASASTHGKAKQIVVPQLSGDVLAGEGVYTRHCQSCHGVNTSGIEKGPSFLHRVYHPGHHNDASIYVAVRKGSRQHHWRFGSMKPVEGISDAEIAQVIAYIRTMQKANGLF